MNFYKMLTILENEAKGMNMPDDIEPKFWDRIDAANRKIYERQKQEFIAHVLPILLKRLGETDRLLARAGENHPDVTRQRESNQAAFGADFDVVLASLQASDKLLHRLRPKNRYERLWSAISSQRDRNMHAIDLATGRG